MSPYLLFCTILIIIKIIQVNKYRLHSHDLNSFHFLRIEKCFKSPFHFPQVSHIYLHKREPLAGAP